MCRWIAYRGETIPLEQYVTAPAHSLVVQSQRALESTAATNGDGFFAVQTQRGVRYTRNGSFQINLRLISDYIVIETNASTEKEKVQAMIGSYAIYEQITKVFQSRIGAYVLDQYSSSIARGN